LDDSTTRRLIWVPIVHSQEDMGRLREAVRQHHTQRHGGDHWDRHVRAVEALWRSIRARVADLDLDPARTRLYQDGLPVCTQVGAIVADLAAAGSENHRLLAHLAAAGATLEGTESPELLLLEYQLALRTLGVAGAGIGPGAQAEFTRLGRDLLQRRDRFIAVRIDDTLQPGETGLIFLGLLHDFGPHLPADLHLERLETAAPPGLAAADPTRRTNGLATES
jgi:hypothetical protein